MCVDIQPWDSDKLGLELYSLEYIYAIHMERLGSEEDFWQLKKKTSNFVYKLQHM